MCFYGDDSECNGMQSLHSQKGHCVHDCHIISNTLNCKFSYQILTLNPQEVGAYFHTYLWGGGFQRYCKSFRIDHKPFYSQVNDKEW